MRRLAGLLLSVMACLSVPVLARAESAQSLLRRAQEAIERGDVDPARDVAPLVAALRGAKGDRAKDLISAVEKLGEYDGTSPAVVKAYLQREAPPALLAIGEARGDWVVRSDALMALRTLNASDEMLDRAIAIAEADTSKEASFFKSRAGLLRSWKQSRPQPTAATRAGRPADPAKEARALALLRRRGLRASASQLETSAREGDAEAVEALLDSGLDANTAGLTGPVLASAAGLGCTTSPGDVEGRVRTVRLLIARGADVKAKDEVGNTLLLRAAQTCPLPVVQALVEAGADIAAANKVGTTALSIAFVGQNWAVAEYLIDRGARMKKADVDSVFFEMPTDAKKAALIRRAMGPAGVTRPAAAAPGAARVASPAPAPTAPVPVARARRTATSDEADGLGMAAMRGDLATVKALLARGVDPNAVGSLGKTPLRMATSVACSSPTAVEKDVLAIVEALLSAGADVNHVDEFGLGELLMAAQKCKASVVTRLLAAGADMEQRSPQGYSPLAMAFIVENHAAAGALVDHGARLGPEAMKKIFPEAPTDPAVAALVKKATGARPPK